MEGLNTIILRPISYYSTKKERKIAGIKNKVFIMIIITSINKVDIRLQGVKLGGISFLK